MFGREDWRRIEKQGSVDTGSEVKRARAGHRDRTGLSDAKGVNLDNRGGRGQTRERIH